MISALIIYGLAGFAVLMVGAAVVGVIGGLFQRFTGIDLRSVFYR